MQGLLATTLIFALTLVQLQVEADENNGIRFYLYTKQNKNKPEEVWPDELLSSDFWNPNSLAIFLVHDWMEQATDDFWRPSGLEPMHAVRDAYLKKKRPENIVVVDWSSYSKSFDKEKVTKGVIRAGEELGEFIVAAKQAKVLGGDGLDGVHIIGTGSGANIAGIAGATVQDLEGGAKIGRITGLDGGQGTGLPKLLKSDRTLLDTEDAKFVQVIHCSTWPMSFKTPKKMMSTAFGHVDFFPEGGVHQAGCKPLIKQLDIAFLSGTCSHMACPKLYAKTIKERKYFGCKCRSQKDFEDDNCDCSGPLMGEFCDSSARGNYYVATEEKD